MVTVTVDLSKVQTQSPIKKLKKTLKKRKLNVKMTHHTHSGEGKKKKKKNFSGRQEPSESWDCTSELRPVWEHRNSFYSSKLTWKKIHQVFNVSVSGYQQIVYLAAAEPLLQKQDCFKVSYIARFTEFMCL